MDRDDNSLLAIVLIGIGALVLFGMVAMTPKRKTSPVGRAEIIRHEGVRYEPYKDSAGYWTIGIGHLIVPGDGVPHDAAGTPQPIDETFVMTLFETDLAKAENAVNKNVAVTLTQGQYDALTDFVFNLGAWAFAASTLRTLLNTGNYPAAAEEFKRWIYAGGKQNPGLIARRDDNYRMFLA